MDTFFEIILGNLWFCHSLPEFAPFKVVVHSFQVTHLQVKLVEVDMTL